MHTSVLDEILIDCKAYELGAPRDILDKYTKEILAFALNEMVARYRMIKRVTNEDKIERLEKENERAREDAAPITETGAMKRAKNYIEYDDNSSATPVAVEIIRALLKEMEGA